MPKKTKTSKTSAPNTNRINKSAWVRGLPKSMSADAVVAKGKAAGVTLSTAQVYTIRSNAKHSKKTKTSAQKPTQKPVVKAAASMSAAGSSAPQKPGGEVNKAALVRSFPTSLPIKDVIAKAKAQGVRLTAKYVHGARAKAKARLERAAAKGGRQAAAASPVASKAKAAAPVRASAGAGGDLSEQFLNLALDVGLVRAAALLVGLRSAARRLTGA
jgi:hypothetical protein